MSAGRARKPAPPTAGIVDELLSHLQAEFQDYDPASQVASFYANRSVFITGATGFIGKALVEKILRSCRDVKRVYLLIRDKRGKEAKDRLLDLIQAPIFNRIRSQPDGERLLGEKLRAVSGDITLARFGVAEADMRELANEVSVVFNSAATIRFSEPIELAVRNNVASVTELVQFCDGLERLEALVHLSTAYSNCHKRDTIYEIFYEAPMSGRQIMGALRSLAQARDQVHVYPSMDAASQLDQDDQGGSPQRSACWPQRFYPRQPPASASGPAGPNLSEDLLEQFTQIALRRTNRPNTYTFTKAIAEAHLRDLIRERPARYLGDKIPVAVVRPSIVGGAWREPDVGFVDNYNGPTGAILSLYTGVLQAMPGRGEGVADLVPVDMVASFLLAAGWYMAAVRAPAGLRAPARPVKRDDGFYLFNFVSGHRNPLHWHQITDMIAQLAYKYPSKFLVRLPSSYFLRAGKLYNLYDWLNHKLPAMVLDFVHGDLLRRELNSRTSAMVAYGRVKAMTETLTPFTSNQWRLSDANVSALYDWMPDIDRQVFQFDVRKIEWPEYIRNYILGSRIYTLKDEPRNVPAAMRALKKRQNVHRLCLAILALVFYYIFVHQSRLELALVSALGF